LTTSTPGIDFLYLELIEHNFLTGKFTLTNSKKVELLFYDFCTHLKKGGKKLGVKNCPQLPINEKSTPGVDFSYNIKSKLRCTLIFLHNFPGQKVDKIFRQF
jgi:hypothetical protein